MVGEVVNRALRLPWLPGRGVFADLGVLARNEEGLFETILFVIGVSRQDAKIRKDAKKTSIELAEKHADAALEASKDCLDRLARVDYFKAIFVDH